MSTEVMYDGPSRADTSGSPGTPDFGATAWETPSGANPLFVSSNTITSTLAAGGLARWRVGQPDMAVHCVINAISSSGGGFGLLARWDGSAYTVSTPLNCYYVFVNNSLSVSLYRAVAGVTTAISNLGSASPGDEIGLSVHGATITVTKNGIVLWSGTDANITTGNYMGIAMSAGSSALASVKTVRASTINAQATVYPYRHDIGWRMPWHVDGSVATYQTGSGNVVLSGAQMQAVNDEDDTGVTGGVTGGANGLLWQIVFPEPRIITGFFSAFNVPTPFGVNLYVLGLDGVTWSNPAMVASNGISSGVLSGSLVSSAWRTAVSSLFTTNPGSVRGIRFLQASSQSGSWTFDIRALHLYGYIPANTGVHRLRLWHPYLDIPLPGAYFDLDDIGSGTLRTRRFRIKNISTAMTANTITADVQSPTYGTALTDEFGLRKNSDSPGVYVPTLSIASLAPGALSEVCEWRRITPSNQPNRIETPIIRLQTASFT